MKIKFAGVGVDDDTLTLDRRVELISNRPARGASRARYPGIRHREYGTTITGVNLTSHRIRVRTGTPA